MQRTYPALLLLACLAPGAAAAQSAAVDRVGRDMWNGAVSPDGAVLAFIEREHVHLRPVAGRRARPERVSGTMSPGCRRLAWSPSGRHRVQLP